MENFFSGCSKQLHCERPKDRFSDRHYLAVAGSQSTPAVRRYRVSRRCKLANWRWQNSLVGSGDASDELRYLARRQPEFLPQCDELPAAGEKVGGRDLLG